MSGSTLIYLTIILPKSHILPSWATDVTLTILLLSLLRFWVWERWSWIAVYGGPDSYQIE